MKVLFKLCYLYEMTVFTQMLTSVQAIMVDVGRCIVSTLQEALCVTLVILDTNQMWMGLCVKVLYNSLSM